MSGLGLLFSNITRAESNSETNELEESSNQGISKQLYDSLKENTPHNLRENIEEIRKVLAIAKEHSIDFSKTYESESVEDKLQEKLRLDTRSLSYYFHTSSYRAFLFGRDFSSQKVEDSLKTLAEVETAFGNHPFHHVIIGRQKEIVNSASQYDLPIPDEFRKYCDVEIPPWQNPHINYRILDNIPEDRAECIPPEYRE